MMLKILSESGSCGAYTKDLNLYDVVLVSSSYSDSSYAKAQNNRESSEISPSAELNNKIKRKSRGIRNSGY